MTCHASRHASCHPTVINRTPSTPPTAAYLVARGRTPEPSPAPDAATSEPAVDDAAAPTGREPQDVQQRAGESPPADQPREGANQ